MRVLLFCIGGVYVCAIEVEVVLLSTVFKVCMCECMYDYHIAVTY